MKATSPFALMNTLFVGLLLSLLCGGAGALAVYKLEGEPEAAKFVEAYVGTFNTAIAFGLILGTALIVFRSQRHIPDIIGAVFRADELPPDYFKYRHRFYSLGDSITFMGEFAAVAFIVFAYCDFRLSALGQAAMTLAACAQWALGVYVGRKLCYVGMMLYTLTDVHVNRNLFQRRELDGVNEYVNVVSTLTIIFVYVHVRAYLQGGFDFAGPLGHSIKLFLVLPAIIATPVLLIFNFYPRHLLRKLYSDSIDVAVKELQAVLQDEGATHLERRSHVIAFDKMCRDELRYSMQLTLNDLPLGITILIMIIEPLVKR